MNLLDPTFRVTVGGGAANPNTYSGRTTMAERDQDNHRLYPERPAGLDANPSARALVRGTPHGTAKGKLGPVAVHFAQGDRDGD